jgi:hypothetical protein
MSKIDWNYRLRCGEGLKPGWAGIMQLTNGFVAAGLPDTSIRTYLLDTDNVGAEYVNFNSDGRLRPQSTRERFVMDAVRKARIRQVNGTGVRDRAEAIEQLIRLRELIDADPSCWRGRGGANDRAVLYAMFDIALARGSIEFSASVRQLADGANIGVRGAHGSLRRLSDWYVVVSLGSGTRATTFRLRPPPEVPTATLSVPEGTDPEGCTEYLAHDVWRHDGLGKSTARIFDLITWDYRTAAEIAAGLGVQRRTVTKHLTKLKRYDLADHLDGIWHISIGDDLKALDALAADLGILGKGQEQRDKHHQRSANRAEFVRYQRQRKSEDRIAHARGTNGNARSQADAS